MSYELKAPSKDTADLLAAFFRENPHAFGDIAQKIDFADISSYQPDTIGVIGYKIGFTQSEFIGPYVLPDVPCGHNEEGSYQEWDKDAFFVADDVVGIRGQVKSADAAVGWKKVSLDVHGRKTEIDPREIRAAAVAGVNLVEGRYRIPQSKVELWKEYQKAVLMTTTGSYASGSHYQSLSGTGQWTHASSDPLNEVWDKIEFVRSQIGKRPTTLWLGPKPGKALTLHPTLRALVAYGASKGAPAAPLTLETLALIFKLQVVQGDAIVKLGLEGSVGFTDCWGDNAGLTFNGPADVQSPKFGMCAVSEDYPKVIDYRNEDGAAEGAMGIKYLDCYLPVATMKSAGYWWADVSA